MFTFGGLCLVKDLLDTRSQVVWGSMGRDAETCLTWLFELGREDLVRYGDENEPYVGIMYLATDTLAVIDHGAYTLPIYLTCGTLREMMGPNLIEDQLTSWRLEYDIPFEATPVVSSASGALLGCRVELPLTHWDKAWLRLEYHATNDTWWPARGVAYENFLEELWGGGRRDRVMRAVLTGFRATVLEARALRALGPAVMRWGLAPGGPLARVAKRTFDDMRAPVRRPRDHV